MDSGSAKLALGGFYEHGRDTGDDGFTVSCFACFAFLRG